MITLRDKDGITHKLATMRSQSMSLAPGKSKASGESLAGAFAGVIHRESSRQPSCFTRLPNEPGSPAFCSTRGCPHSARR